MANADAPTRSICSLGVTDRTLSAFRDDVIHRAEAARLSAHVETCPACRERLDAFDSLASALRSERAPEPDAARLWQAIVTSAGSDSRVRRFTGFIPLSASWRRVGAIAAVILLCVSFATVFSLHRSTTSPTVRPTATLAPALTTTPTAQPTATATPPLLPARPLTWQVVSAPVRQQSTVFANDGESAYMCDVESTLSTSTLRIWHTSDRGAHWTPASVVPNDPSMNECELVVDASDPTVAALAWSPRGGGAGDPYTGMMTTVDGGITWQATPFTPFTRINQLDSRGGVIYALRETANSSNSVEYHLWASSDRMRSWRQVDHGLPSPLAGFWLQPGGSGIVVVISEGPLGSVPTEMWMSPDVGATWDVLNAPGSLPPYYSARAMPFGMPTDGIVVRFLHGHFQLCEANTPASATGEYSKLVVVTCSIDGGVTWLPRTPLPGTGGALVAIADDGALLAVATDASGSRTLYRLAVKADPWQPLGALPESNVFYSPAPGSGVLWAVGYLQGSQQSGVFTSIYMP